MKNINKKDILKDLKNPRAIIPNLLSASRMFAPLIIPPLALSGNIPLVLLTSSAFLLTDFLDGKIARALNGQTKLGQLLDQVSDKICSIGLLVALIPKVPAMVIPLILESTIALINTKSALKNDSKNDGKSLQSGRIKMWPLSISLIAGYGMILSPAPIFEIITYLSLTATAVLEVINIKEYHELSKPENNSEKENQTETIQTKNSKTKSKEKQKENNILDSIEQCTDIDALKEAKKILTSSSKSEDKVKTYQKKKR
ncbi:MAG: CDP-alcohol phosphatidyltransferase family protein [Bacilli bacterium]|nr:CDP-alcohol phosphatidyltransferase family protein [Bacilli bacterium]